MYCSLTAHEMKGAYMYKEQFYINNKNSIPMEQMLEKIDTFKEFERMFPDEFLAEDERIANWLESLIIKYDKNFATLSYEAGLDKSYVGNIVRGVKKNPSRNALISICLAMGTTVEEVQCLLKYAGHSPLYVRRKRDVIIWFGFMKHRKWREVDQDLYDYGFDTLSRSI